MRTTFILLALLLSSTLWADNLEKTQKKDMQAQAKAMIKEAEGLEKTGHLAEARAKYAESQSLIETNGAADAVKRLDQEIRNRVKDTLNESRKLYEQHKYREAAAALEEAMKLGFSQAVLAYDLALCSQQLGDRKQAAEYLRQARGGMQEKKQRQKLLHLLAFVTTGENGASANDSDRDRINRVNRLAESIGLEASLQDDGGGEEDPVEEDDTADAPPAAELKPGSHLGKNIDTNKGPRSSLCTALGEFKGLLDKSPAIAFDLANCAESNGRTTEAEKFLEKYLELSPGALDAEDVRARIADLKALVALEGPNGVEIRRLYATAYGALAER